MSDEATSRIRTTTAQQARAIIRSLCKECERNDATCSGCCVARTIIELSEQLGESLTIEEMTKFRMDKEKAGCGTKT